MLVNCHGNITEINVVSIYQISEKQFSRVLIGSRNLEYPLFCYLFHHYYTAIIYYLICTYLFIHFHS